MSAPEMLEAAPRSAPRRRRRWLIILGLLLSVVLLVGAYVLVVCYLANRDLRQVYAEADRLDPGWRLDELEARRAVLPDEQNAALVLLAAAKLCPLSWPADSKTLDQAQDELVNLSPTEQLNPRQSRVFKDALVELGPALVEMRKVIQLPNGRFAVSYSREGIFRLQDFKRLEVEIHSLMNLLRQAELWLSLDVLQTAQEQDLDGALASCRGLLNVARSVGDHPFVIAQVVRMQVREAACRKIERVLAQGQPSEAALEAVQRLLEQEEAEPLFLYGARGARASWELLFQAFKEGEGGNPLLNTLGPALSLTSHAAILQLETRIVEIAKLPTEEQGRQLQQPDLFAKENFPFLAHTYLVPRVRKETSDLHQGQASSQAALRCTLAAVAAERHRRIHDTWPESLGDLVPDFLAKVPLDPYDGQPLRLRHRDPGLVIYSVGPDGQDDDGNLDRTKPKGPGTDVGMQLWEVAQRRQPPKP